MQPRGLLPEENMFVAVQRDNLPPLRVNTTMNIGRSRTTGTRSRKKAKIATDAADVQEREMEGEEDVLAKQEVEEEDGGEEVESSLMLHMKN